MLVKNSERKRQKKLNESCDAYRLIREANDLTLWINDKEKLVLETNLGQRPDEVELLIRRFNDFKKDLKVNATQINQLNSIADRLRAIIKTDAITESNTKWATL
jgi:spectrin alpha